MAQGIVLNITKNILDVLSPPARQKIGELWGVKAELEKLQETISTIQAVLLHAEEQYHHNPQVNERVARLKDALYDAEDLLGSNQLVLKFKMASKLKQVRMKIRDINDDKTLHLIERPMGREMKITTQREVSGHSSVPMEKIIGRDDDKRKIVRLLLQDSNTEENVSMVSVAGIGGVGKTALAKSVFHEEDVEKHFELRMGVIFFCLMIR